MLRSTTDTGSYRRPPAEQELHDCLAIVEKQESQDLNNGDVGVQSSIYLLFRDK
jgi:hypothetical protein